MFAYIAVYIQSCMNHDGVHCILPFSFFFLISI